MVTRRAPGALEAEVLAALWAADRPLTPEEVRRQLPGELAYTTVMTILVRLHEKGAVRREALGRAYLYAPVLDQAGLSARRMQVLLKGGADTAGVLSRFVASLDEKGRATLRKALGPEP
jgi:predicted transcriptional regulator